MPLHTSAWAKHQPGSSVASRLFHLARRCCRSLRGPPGYEVGRAKHVAYTAVTVDVMLGGRVGGHVARLFIEGFRPSLRDSLSPTRRRRRRDWVVGG